jgi:stage III sporulation protein AD
MELFRVVGIALIGAIAAVLLRQNRPELGMLVSLGCGIILISMGMNAVQQALEVVQRLMQQGGIDREYAAILLKSLGVCIVTQVAADACRDSGENAIAAKIEFIGKLSILGISLPLFAKLLSTITTLLEL